MKTSTIILSLGLLSSLSTIAQDKSAPAATSKEAQSTSTNSGQNRSNADYLYNEKPKDGSAASKADFASGIFSDKAKALDALSGIDNLISPAFEAYLSKKESTAEDIAQYEAKYDEAVEYIRKRDSTKALVILIELSEYPWDARISEQLANRVLAIWDMRRNQKGLMALNKELKNKARTASRNFDQESESVRKKMREQERRQRQGSKGGDSSDSAFVPKGGGGFPSANGAVDAVIGKMELTEQYLRAIEARAKIKLNERDIKAKEDKARRDFSAYIDVLHQGQWHHQARIATDFYRVLFGDGDLPVKAATAAGQSAEIIQRIRDNVEVFEFKVGQNNYSAATKIIHEDFLNAPHHPALRGIKREQKLKVADYLSKLRKLQNLIEARDFGNLDSLLIKLTSDVADFDATKPRALVRAVKREGQMRLGMARLAAQNGDLEKALGEFKAASEAWPDNPELDEASKTFFKNQDIVNKSTVEFDRAVRDANYRFVYEHRLEFAPAIKDDEIRKEQMIEALEKVKIAETALEKAKIYEQNGDSFGAWETLELASKEWPKDGEINRRRADLAMHAASFVSQLSKAKQQERRGNKGTALGLYLNAREEYPSSSMANKAIKRLTDAILGRPATVEIDKEEASKTESNEVIKETDSPK
jgi:hypothetical protein